MKITMKTIVSFRRAKAAAGRFHQAALAILGTAGLICIMAGCASHPDKSIAVYVPPSPPPPPTRVAINRTVQQVQVADRTNFSVDDAIARARLAIAKATTSTDLVTAAELVKVFGPKSRAWNAEDQARAASLQMMLGLAANDTECLNVGLANLKDSTAGIHWVLYESEVTLAYEAYARLGWTKPDLYPTRFTQAMGLFAANQSGFVGDLKFVGLGRGDPAKIKDQETQIQSAVWSFLGDWSKGSQTNGDLQDLTQTVAMAEYRGFRVNLPQEPTDANVLAVRILDTVFKNLGSEL
jgi:hypothetical protein